MDLIFIIVVIIVIIFLIWASSYIGSNVYLKALCQAKRKDKVVALTFDDGPNYFTTPLVLDILKKHKIKATFFLIGKKAKKYPYLVNRIVEEGHIVANHTYSHSNFFPLSIRYSVQEEIEMCSDEINKVIGKKPKLFRPPFGVTNPILGTVVNDLELTTIGWSIRSFDTIPKKREKVCERIISKLHPGAIILLHDDCNDADKLLKILIPSILEKGYKIIPLDEMLELDVYES